MTKNDTTIFIKGDYVTLGQILKFLDLVQTGGEEKIFLAKNNVTFNGEKEERRGKKIRVGDVITINEKKYQICMSKD